MIGLDTNVVVRYLVQDDPEQSRRTNQCIEKWTKSGNKLWICLITLCEVFWVLESCYDLDKEALINVITSQIGRAHV